MRYILLFISLLIAVSLLTPVGYGLYQGYDVVNGLATMVKSLVGRELVYSVPINRPNQPSASEHRPVAWNGELENETLNEASGLAASFLKVGGYFSINGSGNAPELFALNANGPHVEVWTIAYSERHDFEDIEAFGYKGQRYLLLADSGDNFY